MLSEIDIDAEMELSSRVLISVKTTFTSQYFPLEGILLLLLQPQPKFIGLFGLFSRGGRQPVKENDRF